MAIELMCRKIGMTQIFDEAGQCFPVTVLEAGPNTVVQKKTDKTDGYTALQLGFGERRADLFTRPERGHFEKANTAPKRYLRESRIESGEADQYEVGQELKCDLFEAGQRVDVIGTSKGRGFTGVIKRHNFSIMKRTHGTHEAFRHGGAIGAGSYPGRVIKGTGMPGQLGNERVTVRNALLVKVDPDQNLLFVRGGVPGHNDSLVCVRAAVAGG
ncbi:MAG: 50S ribosomal protein L3 [Proteobacteria bacterium]|nr:50S ribosomal protein L3 [Pseudomonadota bacterium]